MKIFLTFGQCHVHHWKGQLLDKDCVVLVEDAPSESDARDALMVLFQGKFCTTYDEETWEKSNYIKHYPRGYITIPWEEIKEMVSIRSLTPNSLREDVKMTRKELQDWLDQFPPDAEIWKNDDGCHNHLESDYIDVTYTKNESVWDDETYCFLLDKDTLDPSKVKRIIF